MCNAFPSCSPRRFLLRPGFLGCSGKTSLVPVKKWDELNISLMSQSFKFVQKKAKPSDSLSVTLFFLDLPTSNRSYCLYTPYRGISPLLCSWLAVWSCEVLTLSKPKHLKTPSFRNLSPPPSNRSVSFPLPGSPSSSKGKKVKGKKVKTTNLQCAMLSPSCSRRFLLRPGFLGWPGI